MTLTETPRYSLPENTFHQSWYTSTIFPDGAITHTPLESAPNPFSISSIDPYDRIHYKIHTSTSRTPTTMFIGGLHADELEGPTILMEEILPRTTIPHIAIPCANPYAAWFETRGWNMQKPDGQLNVIDLNRQFPLAPDGHHPNSQLTMPDAILLSNILCTFPQVGLLLSIHEDHEFGSNYSTRPGGIYVYDHAPSAPKDLEFPRIQHQMNILERHLHNHAFPLFTGYDDPHDPALQNYVDNGYVYQPVKKEDRTYCDHKPFQVFAAHLTNQGVLPPDFRALVIEIPGQLSRERKREAVQLLFDHFIFPLIQQKGLL